MAFPCAVFTIFCGDAGANAKQTCLDSIIDFLHIGLELKLFVTPCMHLKQKVQ